MQIATVLAQFDELCSPAYAEAYDNVGLLVGDAEQDCSGVLVCLDLTDAIIDEAIAHACNLIVAHHPIFFRKINTVTAADREGRLALRLIRQGIGFAAVHTNFDKIPVGVSVQMAEICGLQDIRVLQPSVGVLRKIQTFVPPAFAQRVKDALGRSGAGQIGRYAHCSFVCTGEGSFVPLEGSDPFIGQPGQRETVSECKIEMVFEAHRQAAVVRALLAAHPYEQPAFDIFVLAQEHPDIGLGAIGNFPQPLPVTAFLTLLREKFTTPVVRHSISDNTVIQRVGVCGGSGSSLYRVAVHQGADAFVTADLKYHDFFTDTPTTLLCDIGHYESENACVDRMVAFLRKRNPTFAVRRTLHNTNPVLYFS